MGKKQFIDNFTIETYNDWHLVNPSHLDDLNKNTHTCKEVQLKLLKKKSIRDISIQTFKIFHSEKFTER